MRTTRPSPSPAMNMSENSSRSFWVTRPVGITRQLRPLAIRVRVGMSGQLHFTIDACGVERRIGCRGVRTRERLSVWRFDKLQECSRQAGFLENPEVTFGARIVLLFALHPLEELLSLARRYERPLYAKRSRHRRSDHAGVRETLESLLDDREK